MLNKLFSRLNPAQPVIHSTLAAGEHVWDQTLVVKRLVFKALRAIAKCWSFLKDIHFSWYVMIPVMSSMPAIDDTLAMVLWSLLFLPLLIVITFMALDSVFDLRNGPETAGQPARRAQSRTAGLARGAPYRRPAAAVMAMHSSSIVPVARRHGSLRAARGRMPGLR